MYGLVDFNNELKDLNKIHVCVQIYKCAELQYFKLIGINYSQQKLHENNN